MIDTTKAPFTASEQPEMGVEEPLQMPDIFDWQKIYPRLNALVKDWTIEKTESERRRRIRKVEVNMEELRAQGKLKADEVLIAVRVIDENIKKEQPTLINYITQSRRLAVFSCLSDPSLNVEELETGFTRGMSYDGMIRNQFKTIDGGQTHGWDSVEITFDPKKPLHCGIEHIGHENLLFPMDAKDLQACEFIMRRFTLPPMKLEEYVKKNGFDAATVKELLDARVASAQQVPKNIEFYKIFFKYEGIVYVAWGAIETSATNWLKKPVPMSLGRRTQQRELTTVTENVMMPDVTTGLPISTPVQRPAIQMVWKDEFESEYPIEIYLYMESEEQCITEQKGRVFFDLPWQEAQIALRSLFINGAVRASGVYGSPVGKNITGAPIKKLDITIEHGNLYSDEMTFWHPDYPDPNILRAADQLDVRKASEMGQTASAVINRDDARKTATELNQAAEEQAKISSVSILLLAGFLRRVYARAWYIVQSQAQQNLVIIVPFNIEGLGAQPQQMNNPVLINAVYDIKPAGDIDVVKREERLQKRLMLQPLMQQLGGNAYLEFLKDIIREMLPEDAQKYIMLIGQDQQAQQMIQSLAMMLKEAVTDETGKIKPEFKEMEPQLKQVAATVMQGMQGGMGGQPQQPAMQQ